MLQEWCKETPYPGEGGWVFASPYTIGERPSWPDSALVDYIGCHEGWSNGADQLAHIQAQRGHGVYSAAAQESKLEITSENDKAPLL